MTTAAPVANAMRPILPSHGVARVKNVLSGDTVVLLGKALSPDAKAPEVVFTFERVSAPRCVQREAETHKKAGACQHAVDSVFFVLEVCDVRFLAGTGIHRSSLTLACQSFCVLFFLVGLSLFLSCYTHALTPI